MRIGAKIDNFGERAATLRAVADAQAAEAAGFDSLWMSDHILMPVHTDTPYPFTDSGELRWDPSAPWFDALIWSAMLVTCTQRVEIGTATLIPGLRNPLELAKQVATLDVVSGGRFAFGVGAGWLTEEFAALGYPSTQRGARLDEWLELCRAAWTGRVEPRTGRFFVLDRAVHMQPTPSREIPVLIGGMTDHTLRRVARHHAGWLPLLKPSEDPVATLSAGIARIHEAAEENGRPYTEPLRVMLSAGDPLALGGLVGALERIGVTDLLVEVDFDDPSAPERAVRAIRG